MSVELEVRGLEDAIEALDIGAPQRLENVITLTVEELAKFIASITPVLTGAMRGAWTSQAEGLEARVFIDPSATNPMTGAPVTSYASLVDARLGILDTAMMMSARIVDNAMEDVGWLPR